MRRLLAAAIMTLVVLITVLLATNSPTALLQSVSAQAPTGTEQSDHATMGVGEHIHCGVALKQAEPWTLHVSAKGGSTGAGTLTITFADGDQLLFSIPANSSFSLTQEFGGVPEVDDVILIELTTPGINFGTIAVASARANGGASDPFSADGEKDNFCLTHPDDPGVVPTGYPQ